MKVKERSSITTMVTEVNIMASEESRESIIIPMIVMMVLAEVIEDPRKKVLAKETGATSK